MFFISLKKQLRMETEAIRQLENIEKYLGVVDCVGLPDLHPAKTPVGTTIVTKNVIYPSLIGNDIGCGIAL